MHEYIIFYKPYGIISQFSPEGEKDTLADYFKDLDKNIYPVGRLDHDSEGLLLLTNDKSLTHRLLDPSFEHRRTYWIQVEGEIHDDAIKRLEQGVFIKVKGKMYRTKPAVVKKFKLPPIVPDRVPPIRFRKNIPTSWVSITVTEGKNRQIRHMTAAVGFPTLRLIRYSIGKINIEGIEPGRHKYLKAKEVPMLLN
jgi:23S rRNA pseudouridine2457 synthase